MEKKILIVDDSKLARNKVKNILLELGYNEFYEAENGQEAINMFLKHSPYFMTLDIEMPILDGIEVVKELVQVSDSLNVIWVSSIDNKHRTLQAQKLCPSSIVKKPVSLEKLTNAIKLLKR